MIHRPDGSVAAGRFPRWPPASRCARWKSLNFAAVAAAQRTIYLENQYLASRALVTALAGRLREPDSPDIVIVLPRRSESRLERESMDSARHDMLQLLWAADVYSHLGVFWAVADGEPVYVPSKLMIVDDRLLRIGSSNLTTGPWDSTASATPQSKPTPVMTPPAELGCVISATWDRLVSEHLGVSVDDVAAAVRGQGSFPQAVRSVRRRRQNSCGVHRRGGGRRGGSVGGE